ncbi:MAG: SDR family NAD(P)-dependent oxidoreductase [Thermodesulfobacteriota bacterium]|nr:SDR family NAD(P)-dependent oxidoreductase [Thermodesulfobacteriota bacterium]
MDLKGKNVFITGGASGIGKELARCFAAEGANLVLAGMDSEKELLVQWCAELEKTFAVTVRHVTGDLSTPDGPARVFEQVRACVPHIDVLVNNAGMMVFGSFHELSAERQEQVMAVNLRAYMLLMRYMIPEMVHRGAGAVFNVSSVSAFVPTPRHAIYGATKAFVQSLSEAVDQELQNTGVHVFTLNPGYTDTPLLEGNGFPKKLRFYSFAGKSSPADIARKGVDAFKRGKRVYIPEPHLWFLFFVLNRFTPRRIINMVSGLMVKGA